MTPEAFRDYYSFSHLQLIRELTGPAFPRLHRQHYIQRTNTNDNPASNNAPNDQPIDAKDYAATMPSANQGRDTTSRNATTPANVLLGTQADFDYDCIATLEFDSVDGFKAFFEAIKKPGNWEKVIADEENFLDRSKTLTAVLGDVVELRPL